MAYIPLKRRRREQPTGETPLDKSHWLAKDVTFAITGDAPWFNSAKEKESGISRGGSGFTQRGTRWGNALYTPNGGWANFAVNEDWAGPNTVIAICRVNDMDNPWGVLFCKNTSGTATQFAVGRFSSEDFIYGSVDDSTALKYSGSSSVSGLVAGFNVIAFTHSGVTSTGKSYYLNGSLVGSTIGLAAQPTGTGPLGLGRGRDSNASFDSDVDWLGFVRAKRVLSAVEIAELTRSVGNTWDLWKPRTRKIQIAGAASADGVGSASGTSTASGVGASTAESVASSSGAGTASGVGQAVTESVGSASGVATVSGVGTSGTGSSGSASGSASVAGVGAAITASTGSGSGLALASGVGSSTATSTGASSGTSTVSGVGDSIQAGSAVGNASGTSTISGIGASVVSATGSASGSSTVVGVTDAQGQEVEDFGGDDAPIIIRKRKKKALREQPNKHLEHILNTAIDEFQGKVRPTLKLKKNKGLEVKEPVLVPPPSVDSNSPEFEGFKTLEDSGKDAEKVAQLLAEYQQQVRAMEDDEDLIMLIAEFF